jgi:cytochrome c oxidase subunit IV
MQTPEASSGGLTRYLVVYFCILAVSALQILIAYQNIDGRQMLLRMMTLAVLQAALAITFFMHMKSEQRSLALFLIPATVFVLVMMNMIWSDSFRLLDMRPFAH